MIGSPSNLEVLLHCYYSSEPHPRADAPAVMEGINYLINTGMIYAITYNGNTGEETWKTTAKGEAYIEHLMSIPFPVATWVIPDSV